MRKFIVTLLLVLCFGLPVFADGKIDMPGVVQPPPPPTEPQPEPASGFESEPTAIDLALIALNVML